MFEVKSNHHLRAILQGQYWILVFFTKSGFKYLSKEVWIRNFHLAWCFCRRLKSKSRVPTRQVSKQLDRRIPTTIITYVVNYWYKLIRINIILDWQWSIFDSTKYSFNTYCFMCAALKVNNIKNGAVLYHSSIPEMFKWYSIALLLIHFVWWK